MIAAIRGKGEHQPSDQRCSRIASEPSGEHVRRRRRPGHTSQGEHVEDRERREPGREQRPRGDGLRQHGVRVRQRLLRRPEDLPIEERPSSTHVVDHSSQPPGGEGRVEVGDHTRREIGCQRPCEEHRHRRVEDDNPCTTLDARRPYTRSGGDVGAISFARVRRVRPHGDAEGRAFRGGRSRAPHSIVV